MGISGQRHAPTADPLEKKKNPRYTLISTLGGPQNRTGRLEK